jgi:hypothetical protein
MSRDANKKIRRLLSKGCDLIQIAHTGSSRASAGLVWPKQATPKMQCIAHLSRFCHLPGPSTHSTGLSDLLHPPLAIPGAPRPFHTLSPLHCRQSEAPPRTRQIDRETRPSASEALQRTDQRPPDAQKYFRPGPPWEPLKIACSRLSDAVSTFDTFRSTSGTHAPPAGAVAGARLHGGRLRRMPQAPAPG